MAGTLTGASAVITLSIQSLFPNPIQLQGFAADDVFDIDAIEIAETQMGVDGHLSAGYVNKEVKQTYSLMADSDSNDIFEAWAQQQRAQVDAFVANGRTNIRATGRTYIMTRGFLTSFQVAPSTGKLLKPRKYTITWESVNSTPNAPGL